MWEWSAVGFVVVVVTVIIFVAVFYIGEERALIKFQSELGLFHKTLSSREQFLL